LSHVRSDERRQEVLLRPQELFGQIRVGDHVERPDVGGGGFDHRTAARLFRGMRIGDQQAAVPVARGGLE